MGKVLIIDDEKQILGLLSRIIGLEGYEVLQAATCKAGLRQMEQHSPEVVLCDVFLPDGNGVDLVSDLKKLRPLSEIILLCLLYTSDAADEARSVGLGGGRWM